MKDGIDKRSSSGGGGGGGRLLVQRCGRCWCGIFVVNILVLLFLALQLHVVDRFYDAFSSRTKASFIKLDRGIGRPEQQQQQVMSAANAVGAGGGAAGGGAPAKSWVLPRSPADAWRSTETTIETLSTGKEQQSFWIVTNTNGV
jgi:hypothetical protein